MSFDAIQLQASAGILAGPGSQEIRYRRVYDTGPSAWATIRAIVNPAGPDVGENVIGMHGHWGRSPLRVTVLASACEDLREGRDEFLIEDVVYRVQAILDKTAGLITVYAKP